MRSWEPSFDFYFPRTQHRPVAIALDLHAVKHAPLVTHPMSLTAQVTMREARADGLRSWAEASALFALEDQIVRALTEELDAIYVGRVVSAGRTEFLFYVPAPADAGAPDPVPIVGDVAPYEVQWTAERDPGWDGYRALYPDAFGLHSIVNRRIQAHLRKSGERLEVERDVDHLARFASEDMAQQASSALVAAGFRVDSIVQSAEESWVLPFHRRDRCDGERPDRFVFEVLQALAPFDGEYDGWGSMLDRSETDTLH